MKKKRQIELLLKMIERLEFGMTCLEEDANGILERYEELQNEYLSLIESTKTISMDDLLNQNNNDDDEEFE